MMGIRFAKVLKEIRRAKIYLPFLISFTTGDSISDETYLPPCIDHEFQHPSTISDFLKFLLAIVRERALSLQFSLNLSAFNIYVMKTDTGILNFSGNDANIKQP